MVRTNRWRDSVKDPRQHHLIEEALISGTFIAGEAPPIDPRRGPDRHGVSDCPMAPGEPVIWRTTYSWLVRDKVGGGRDWVMWSYLICLGRWARFKIVDADEEDAYRVAHWVDEEELADDWSRLASRLGTYWADAAVLKRTQAAVGRFLPDELPEVEQFTALGRLECAPSYPLAPQGAPSRTNQSARGEVRCRMCGKVLKDEAARRAGIGADCARNERLGVTRRAGRGTPRRQ